MGDVCFYFFFHVAFPYVPRKMWDFLVANRSNLILMLWYIRITTVRIYKHSSVSLYKTHLCTLHQIFLLSCCQSGVENFTDESLCPGMFLRQWCGEITNSIFLLISLTWEQRRNAC